MRPLSPQLRVRSEEMRDLSTADLDWVDDSVASFETASIIDRHSSFDGNFRSQRDLRVDGELKGNVTCEGTLFVSEGATIAATVQAEHISVAGELSGEIRCRGRFQILPSGRVRANVSTGSLVIQEGAIYEGQLEMAGIERSTLRPIRSRSSPPSVGSDPGQPERQQGNGTTYIRRLGSPEAPWESPEGDSDDAPAKIDSDTHESAG
jgi:cytoskeletal protein CcmA (bactofilin family)